MNIKKIAKSLPHPIEQSLRYAYGVIPPSLRYGKAFRQMISFLKESQWWEREKLEEYQMQCLIKILKHAYENVPHYRKVFDESGIKPEHIQSFDDMKSIPLVGKEDMRDRVQDFIASNYKTKKLSYVTTAGSTGIPFGFYELKSYTEAVEWAFIYTQWSRVGYKSGDKSILLRGGYTGDPDRNQYWYYEPVDRRLFMSSYHLTEEKIPDYLEQIRQFEPDFIQAFPSAISMVARYIVENGIQRLPKIKAILAGSENLYPSQRELLERAFNTRVFSWYGHSEKVVLAPECECSNYYHIFPEYGYTEVLDTDGNYVTKEGEMGELIGTGFYNFAMPFIRYKTRDLAIVSNKKCDCGRNYRLLSRIEGRLQELIITKKNRLLSMATMNMHSDALNNVKQFQFYQDTKGEVVFNIIKKDNYADKDTQNIRMELGERLGDDVDLIIKFVDDIPLTKGGKYRLLIQKLPIKWSD